MDWFFSTAVRAASRLRRFLLVFLPIVVLYGGVRILTGAADFGDASVVEWLVIIALLMMLLYVGAFLIAAVLDQATAPTTLRYLLAWTAAGALVVPSFFALAHLLDKLSGIEGDPQGLMDGPGFWVVLIVGGAFTGLMYGYHAMKWRDKA